MTDIKRIKRLAKWMGWEYLEDEGNFVGFHRPNDNPIID